MAKSTSAGNRTEQTIRQEVVRSVRKMAQDAEWRIHLAFERAGCSCHPQRLQLERLEGERKAKLDAAHEEIDEEFENQIAKLEREVEEIDRREHPDLDAVGRRATYFYAAWMLERLANGDASFLDQQVEEREARFAEAWLAGWRPALARRP
ncbi:MAG: hypothetical protein WD379_06965 [Dehalococcoidia bacterium]